MINIYWNAHFCLHNFHASQCVTYWSKKWGKGSIKSIGKGSIKSIGKGSNKSVGKGSSKSRGDSLLNGMLECRWNIIFKSIIDGLGHIVVDSLVKSRRKVLYSICCSR